ncbi:conserved Plasmodium protein, unknown function [Plasmodium ovale wallikeri]|uniref:Uncharacterized protein n=2 Tax=Plasmodium ovale TaxID=36330 RepID=A0A1A8ZGI8_PLAOA|nr:conserved Plasmodium protein, unknown function [Plasmodium ovale wallikeri]SBT43409.1 conserved Plasmodium protein, unknown function [Plasmodium ovale wallikeri]SBT78427.1 conserved Plasmodium protein, unknown function [Plasmodium ovale]
MLRGTARRCFTGTRANGWGVAEGGTEYRRVRVRWGEKNICLHICDLVPRNKNNAEKLEIKNMNIINDIKKTKYDCVIFGIGYVDYDKILKSFNRAELIQRKMIDCIHFNLKKINGQYISIIQQCLLLNIPHFCLGRDRLTELTSIGTSIFSNPKEIFSLLYYFLINSEYNEEKKKNSNDKISDDKIVNVKDNIEYNLRNNCPHFYNALVVENALYLIYNLHATLLRILKSKYYYVSFHYDENISRKKDINKRKIKKWKFFSFFNETTYDQINNLRNKIKNSELYADYKISSEKNEINILIICDSICVDYLYNYIKNNFYLLHNVSPFYNELYSLENKNTYKFTLSLFLFIIAPIAWTITFLTKYLYRIWVEFFTKGKVITVGGDNFFENDKLIDIHQKDFISDNNEDYFLKSLNEKDTQFETVSLLGGLLQWFKNKSRS